VRDILVARYDTARSRPRGPDMQAAQAQSATSGAPLGLVPDTAGITNAFAAAAATSAVPAPVRYDTRPMFEGLFQDGGSGAPLASAVSELWTVPGSPAASSSSVAGSMLDLFQDPARRSKT
jgi:hypothetical protein